MYMLPVTPDLFADPATPSALKEFESSFEAWVDDAQALGRLRQRSSEEVYRAIWGGFVEWCVAQHPPVRLRDLSADDLALFVATRKGIADRSGVLSPRYTWRVLNLIDRVLRHGAKLAGTRPNVAAVDAMNSLPGVRYANAVHAPLPDHLQPDEARALVIFLSHVRPRGSGTAAGRPWQELRNRAAVALQLGAGLAPGDVRAMTLDGVVAGGGRLRDVPWKLLVPEDGNTPARETPVAPWAGQLLRYWLGVRLEVGIPGPWLFPSTRTGKPWGKGAQYLAAKQVLEDAGMDAADGGSFRLRHTFALRQLRRGREPADVARWLGIANVAEIERYLRVLHGTEGVV
ncbi:MAG: site-specific integrase [Burkholderiaceae bacterium]